MRLTVLSIAYPLALVMPDSVGGAEQVLAWLDQALVRAGHRSLVIAMSGSHVAGELFQVAPVPGEMTAEAQMRVHEDVRCLTRKLLSENHIDVIHMHGVDFHCYLPPGGVPVLATLHLPPSWYPAEIFTPARPDIWLNCVSETQHMSCPPSAALVSVVENGADPGENVHRGRVSKRGYALAMGRICPEKGFHSALHAAKLAGFPLLLAGHVFPYGTHQAYFRDCIMPQLDSRRRFIGAVSGARKHRLLSGARCLLVTSTAPETSSLVAREALMSGTPVIAFPNGALPEIIEHGRTGFLVRDEQEMAEAISAAAELDPEVCREEGRKRFSLNRMTTRYLELYAKLATRGAEVVA